MPFYFDQDGTLRVREFERWPWLVHGFSSRLTGDLRKPKDQQKFAAKLDMEMVTLRQVHSAIIRMAGNGAAVAGLPGDALVASRGGLLLGVKTADCLPILLVDARRRAVGAVHSGWRGTLARVAEKAVSEMRIRFGSKPADLHAAIGPGIRTCCFEVGPEVLDEFASQFTDADQFCRRDPANPALIMLPKQIMTGPHALMRNLESDQGRVDLAEAVRLQLLRSGLASDRILDSGLCTACDLERFFSHRRERDAAGRMLSVIGVRRGT